MGKIFTHYMNKIVFMHKKPYLSTFFLKMFKCIYQTYLLKLVCDFSYIKEDCVDFFNVFFVMFYIIFMWAWLTKDHLLYIVNWTK